MDSKYRNIERRRNEMKSVHVHHNLSCSILFILLLSTMIYFRFEYLLTVHYCCVVRSTNTVNVFRIFLFENIYYCPTNKRYNMLAHRIATIYDCCTSPLFVYQISLFTVNSNSDQFLA